MGGLHTCAKDSGSALRWSAAMAKMSRCSSPSVALSARSKGPAAPPVAPSCGPPGPAAPVSGGGQPACRSARHQLLTGHYDFTKWQGTRQTPAQPDGKADTLANLLQVYNFKVGFGGN